MHLWKKWISLFLLALAVASLQACAPTASPLSVRSATVEHGMLVAELDWQPSTALLDALDHGIALDFEITLDAQAPARFGWTTTLAQIRWQRELRYFPLTRQYQLRDPERESAGNSATRSYAARAQLLAAISDLQLDLPADWPQAVANRYALRIDLERDTLPGALRLPALIDADWRVSAEYRWNP